MLKLYNASNESITMPLTMALDTFNRGRRVPVAEIINGGGVLSGIEAQEVKNFSIRGTIYYQNLASMREFLDTLLAFLEKSPIRVYQDEADSRFIYARCTNVTDNWMDGRAELELTIDMTATDPFFYSIEHVDTQTINSATKTFSIFVGGNKDVFPYMLLNKTSGSISSLKINNTTNSNSISFVDEITTSISIDNKNLMILSGTTSILSRVNTSWLINGFVLKPGENVITVTGTGSFNYELITKWRSKWL